MNAQESLLQASRWKKWEFAFWVLAFLSPWVLGSHALIINEIAIVALFAVSLDLILGYTGIVSLGHAAFFGMGAYSSALFAKHVMPDPTLGLLVGTAAATLLGALFSLTIMRGTDLTRLMVTLGAGLIMMELANKLDWLTGGADGLQGVTMGPLLGTFEFDLAGRTAAWYSLTVLLILFVLARRLVHSPLGATFKAIRDNRLRAMAIGVPVSSRLALVYTAAAGMAGASLVATIVVCLTAAWGVGEVAGYKRSLEHHPLEAPWFYGIFAVCLIAGGVLVASGVNLVELSVAVEVMNALLLPLVLGFLYLLALKTLPHPYRLQGAYKWIVGAVVGITACFGFYAGIAGAFGG